jgi:predicted DNA-binding transcriptional regulator AlpA
MKRQLRRLHKLRSSIRPYKKPNNSETAETDGMNGSQAFAGLNSSDPLESLVDSSEVDCSSIRPRKEPCPTVFGNSGRSDTTGVNASQDFASLNSPGAVPESLLDSEEVARILNVPRSWVYNHADDLPVIRLGRYIRFTGSAIKQFLEKRGPCK